MKLPANITADKRQATTRSCALMTKTKAKTENINQARWDPILNMISIDLNNLQGRTQHDHNIAGWKPGNPDLNIQLRTTVVVKYSTQPRIETHIC